MVMFQNLQKHFKQQPEGLGEMMASQTKPYHFRPQESTRTPIPTYPLDLNDAPSEIYQPRDDKETLNALTSLSSKIT